MQVFEYQEGSSCLFPRPGQRCGLFWSSRQCKGWVNNSQYFLLPDCYRTRKWLGMAGQQSASENLNHSGQIGITYDKSWKHLWHLDMFIIIVMLPMLPLIRKWVSVAPIQPGWLRWCVSDQFLLLRNHSNIWRTTWIWTNLVKFHQVKLAISVTHTCICIYIYIHLYIYIYVCMYVCIHKDK